MWGSWSVSPLCLPLRMATAGVLPVKIPKFQKVVASRQIRTYGIRKERGPTAPAPLYLRIYTRLPHSVSLHLGTGLWLAGHEHLGKVDPQHLSSPSRVRQTGVSPVCSPALGTLLAVGGSVTSAWAVASQGKIRYGGRMPLAACF